LSLLARGGGAKKSPTKPIGSVSAIPNANLIWAGNDEMATGAMAARQKRGGKPGIDA